MRTLKYLLTTLAAASALVLLTPALAQAHPLGNFTINHYDGLTLHPDRVDDLAVVDRAEIPTMQARDAIDTDHDGVLAPAELQAYAVTQCATIGVSVRLTADGTPVRWTVNHAGMELLPGAAGLPTSRITCALTASVRLTAPPNSPSPTTSTATTSAGAKSPPSAIGVHLDHSPVPSPSVSAELRHYPNDLLSSPLDVRSAVLNVLPGPGADTGAAFALPTTGLADRYLGRLTGTFTGLVGARHLTFGIGLLALLLSLVLGASHAAMPGHGKTVMAAYLAGKHGTTRDALTVGATVTFTHTAGVLALGLLLSASASLAGESILNWLGVVSGMLIAVIGISLLRSAWGSRRGPSHSRDEHGHDHEHHHDHGHDHSQGTATATGLSTGTDMSRHAPSHSRRHGRRNLIGMGVAGGLVPSPSALVVLLGAVALGRTAFGIALVLGYGLGMAATLTAAGLLLVRLQKRAGHTRLGSLGPARLLTYTPVATALLVLTVGAGLALRSLTPLL